MVAIDFLLGSSVNGYSSQSALTGFRKIEARTDFYKGVFDKQAETKRDLAYFKEKFPKVTSVDALLKDRRLTEFVLGAVGLEAAIDQKAIIKKALTEDPAATTSLVNRLADPRWAQFAKAMSFLNTEPAKAADAKVQVGLVEGWRTNGFEKWAGETNGSAVREAMYFKRTISSVNTMWQAIANPTIGKVLRVGLGQPEAFAALDADKQHARLIKGIDLAEFKDPKKVDRFLQRFLANSDRAAAGVAAGPVVTTLQGIAANMRGMRILV